MRLSARLFTRSQIAHELPAKAHAEQRAEQAKRLLHGIGLLAGTTFFEVGLVDVRLIHCSNLAVFVDGQAALARRVFLKHIAVAHGGVEHLAPAFGFIDLEIAGLVAVDARDARAVVAILEDRFPPCMVVLALVGLHGSMGGRHRAATAFNLLC